MPLLILIYSPIFFFILVFRHRIEKVSINAILAIYRALVVQPIDSKAKKNSFPFYYYTIILNEL